MRLGLAKAAPDHPTPSVMWGLAALEDVSPSPPRDATDPLPSPPDPSCVLLARPASDCPDVGCEAWGLGGMSLEPLRQIMPLLGCRGGPALGTPAPVADPPFAAPSPGAPADSLQLLVSFLGAAAGGVAALGPAGLADAWGFGIAAATAVGWGRGSLLLQLYVVVLRRRAALAAWRGFFIKCTPMHCKGVPQAILACSSSDDCRVPNISFALHRTWLDNFASSQQNKERFK
jgi:hypothetical protein